LREHGASQTGCDAVSFRYRYVHSVADRDGGKPKPMEERLDPGTDPPGNLSRSSPPGLN
jgi:hypothetical protein